jgi:hypothetical protein
LQEPPLSYYYPEKDVEGAELTLAALREIQHIGFWNLAASSIGVLASFALPVIQAFLK